ncbi:ribosomal protein L28e [Pluteus cervinus]|uniref:Ribosomal protein L28e n=1 Tax=Pluteus cervinus TaxID=181527 RepID=A0ACD3AW51_9AGAR|nr:ribosomal protein L28e [Pluteus cervinus]
MSTDLQWLLLRKNNSFIVKRGGVEAQIFSKEPGNPRNLHSHKFSGLANEKTIDVSDSATGIRITTRKVKASTHAVATARAVSSIRPRSGARRSLGAAIQPAKRGYRPDLRTAVLARVSALVATQTPPKPTPPKKVRGKKAKATTAADPL